MVEFAILFNLRIILYDFSGGQMRFKKSVKILPGVRVNFSKSGISTTLGVKGFSVNIGETGTYLNTGIPGTGLYDRIKIGDNASHNSMSSTFSNRAAKQFQKELEKKQKEINRLNQLQQAELEVLTYENYVSRLLSIHKECAESLNWQEIAQRQAPVEVKPNGPPAPKVVKAVHENELYYQNLINGYKPNFLAKLLKIDQKKYKEWNLLLVAGRRKDEERTSFLETKAKTEYIKALDDYSVACEETKREYESALDAHNSFIALANRITANDTDAFAIVLESLDPFQEISEFGSEIDCTIISSKEAKVVITVHDDEVIPKQIKSLMKSGKLSLKDMPIGKFNEIYQDYVCSAALRIARDSFAILPFDRVIVTAIGQYLDKSTGHEEEGPILSVLFDRQTLGTLNFEALDPSDSMSNFKCNMTFKKAQGMSGTDELDFGDE